LGTNGALQNGRICKFENLPQRRDGQAGRQAGRLHFLPTFKTLGAFIHLRISMAAAIMTGTFTTDQ